MVFARKFPEGLADIVRRGAFFPRPGGVIVFLLLVAIMFSVTSSSLRSGFRLRTPAALTPQDGFNFLLRRCHYVPYEFLRFAQDSPADSRALTPQDGSTFCCVVPLCFRYEFLRFAQDLPADSRCAHARKTAQLFAASCHYVSVTSSFASLRISPATPLRSRRKTA